MALFNVLTYRIFLSIACRTWPSRVSSINALDGEEIFQRDDVARAEFVAKIHPVFLHKKGELFGEGAVFGDRGEETVQFKPA